MNNQITQQQKGIAALISSETFKNQIKSVLPAYLTPERMVRIAVSELRTNPKLANCDPYSFAGAIMRCAQIGLEPSSEAKHVYLIPYGKECQLQISYLGYMALAKRNNISIKSHIVKDNDEFMYKYDPDLQFAFTPNVMGERGEMRGVFALARVKHQDGELEYMVEYMTRDEIDKIKALSKAGNSSSSPWSQHYEAMARKTVIRKLCKDLALIIPAMASAVHTDDESDMGKQNNAAYAEELLDSDNIDIEAPIVETGVSKLEERIKNMTQKEE